jgi:RNA polymerase sigma-70 factor, ECF subfamily
MRDIIATLKAHMRDDAPPLDIAELARAYGRHVFSVAYRVLGDAAQAEDVQQDVFLRLIQSPPRDVASWPAFLATSATRLAIDRLRRVRRWQRLVPSWLVDRAVSSPAADAAVLAHERAAQLRNAIARLSAREAECFALRHVQGLEIAEIASTLAVSTNVVNVSLHRATQALRRRLAADAIESEETSA